MKIKKFYDKVFVVDVTALSGKREEVNKWLKKQGSDYELDEGVEGFCRFEKGKPYWIYVSNPKDFYTLLHETTHLIGMITERNGVGSCLMKNESEVDDTLAYYLAYWFRELWRFYGNIKVERRKN